MTQRVKLTVAYLGTSFAGWQRQTNARTVQGELEKAISSFLRGPAPTLMGAGRTDTGVHARAQVAHVDLPRGIPADRLMTALNKKLPQAIRIQKASFVSNRFHACRDAKAKHYCYRFLWEKPSLPWIGLRSAVGIPPDHPERLLRALKSLEGQHDFASFSVRNLTVGSTTRKILRTWSSMTRCGLTLHFVGDGFLRYQVRRMTGALLEVGQGKRRETSFADLLCNPNPGAFIYTAPGCGLTLEHVYYRRPRFASETTS